MAIAQWQDLLRKYPGLTRGDVEGKTEQEIIELMRQKCIEQHSARQCIRKFNAMHTAL